jgi:hypothetical protein
MGAFDDLVPSGRDGAFDDLIPRKPESTERPGFGAELARNALPWLSEGVNTIAGAPFELAAPDGSAADFFRRNAEWWRTKQSDELQARLAASGQRIDAAGKDGVMSQIGAAAGEYWDDPILAARLGVTNIPSLIPGLGLGKVAQVAGAAGKLGVGAQAALGLGVAGGTNAVLNAGGARGESFEDLKKAAMARGIPEADAVELALQGSKLAAAVGGVVGFIGGRTGVEKALLGAASPGKALASGARAAAAELAGEQIEEVAPKLATNFAGQTLDQRSLGQDVGRTIVDTAVGSGPMAAAAGGATAYRALQAAEKPAPAPADLTGAVADDERAAADEAVAALNKPPVELTALDRVQQLDAQIAAAAPDSDLAPLQAERAALSKDWPAMNPGTRTTFSTETGAQLEGQYALIDIDDLKASHDGDLKPNPAYPKALQPRERDRAASATQIQGIVSRLDPARLGESATAAEGAPIIGADGLVESGNARTIALGRVYAANGLKAKQYRDWLAENAERFGLTAQQIEGMRKPVLVRVRSTPVNRAEFARQANAPTVAVMSPREQALSDAARIDNLDDLRPTDKGDFSTSRDFLRRFVGGLSQTERGAVIDADGGLSATGYARARNAVLAKAYGDSPVLTRLVESMDDTGRNIAKALIVAAPRMAQVRAMTAAGQRHNADLTPALVEAAGELERLRQSGQGVGEALQQQAIDGHGRSAAAGKLLRFMSDNARRPRRIADLLQAYADALDAAGDPAQGSLLGDSVAPTVDALLDGALREVNASDAAVQTQPQAQAEGGQAPATGGIAGSPAAPATVPGAAVPGVEAPGVAPANDATGPDWVGFGPESGTLGIPRAEMPQVKMVDRGAMVNFLKARGIEHEIVEVDPASLKPTEAEFSRAKVRKSMDAEGDTATALVSADGYVVDGHHRWLAQRVKGEPLRALRFNAPALQVIEAIHAFPSSRKAGDSAQDPRRAAVQDFKDALADLGEFLTKHQRAAIVQEHTPEMHAILVKLFESAVTIIGTDLKRAISWAKQQLKANQETKTTWNKITAEEYRKAALEALENVQRKAPAGGQQGGLFDDDAAATAAVQGDLFAEPKAAPAPSVAMIDGRPYDMERDNFNKAYRLSEIVDQEMPAEALAIARTFVAAHDGQAKAEAPTISAEERARAEALLAPRMRLASDAKVGFDQAVLDIVKDTGAIGQMLAPLKGMKRSAEKLVLEEQFNVDGMKDLLRSTILVSSYADAQQVVDEIRKRFKVLRVKDRSDSAGITGDDVQPVPRAKFDGYADVLVNVITANGTIGEVQINVPVMMAAKDAGPGHKMYEIGRAQPAGSDLRLQASAAQVAYYDAAFLAAAERYDAAKLKNLASGMNAADLSGNMRTGASSSPPSDSLKTDPSGNSTNSSPPKDATKKQPSGNLPGTFITSPLQQNSTTGKGSAPYKGDLFSAPAPVQAAAPAVDKSKERLKFNYKPPALAGVVGAELAAKVDAFVRTWKDKLPKSQISAEDRVRAEAMLEPVMAAAIKDEPVFDAGVRKIAAAIGGDYMLGPTKKMERTAVKLVEEGFDLNEMKDIVRATLVVKSYDQAQAVIDAIGSEFKLRQIGNKSNQSVTAPEGVRIKNKGPSAEGYQDVTVFVYLPSGGTAEIQINTPEMLSAKDAGHTLYEGSRVVEKDQSRQGEYAELRDAQAELYSAAFLANRRNWASVNDPMSEPTGSALRGTSSSDSSLSLNTDPSGNSTQVDAERSSWNRVPGGNLPGTSIAPPSSPILPPTGGGKQDNSGAPDGEQNGTDPADGNAGQGPAGQSPEVPGGTPGQGPEAGVPAGSGAAGPGSGVNGSGPGQRPGQQPAVPPEGPGNEQRGAKRPRNRPGPSGGEPAGRTLKPKSGLNYRFTDDDISPPVFLSRGAGGGMNLAALRGVKDRLAARLAGLPPVKVLASPADAPAALRAFIEKRGAMADVEGAYFGGQIYLFASGIVDEARAEHVLAEHEAAHAGLAGLLGAGRARAMQAIYNQNASIRRLVKPMMARGVSLAEAVEEAIVDMPSGRLARLQGWRAVVGYVRDALRRGGFERLAEQIDGWLAGHLTDQQRADLVVADLVRAARAFVGRRRAGSASLQPATAAALSDGKLADDLAEQEKWLNAEARARGFKDIDDLAENAYPVFEKLAEKWREKHPADALLSTKSSAFKRWFGESKVTHEFGKRAGEPKVMYHSTVDDFTSFRPNAKGLIFLAEEADEAERIASVRQHQRAGRMYKPSQPGVADAQSTMPVFVAAENPFDHQNAEHRAKLLPWLKAAMERDADLKDRVESAISLSREPWMEDEHMTVEMQVEFGNNLILEDTAVVDWIRGNGFDAFWTTELDNDDGGRTLAVFAPEQIKSATGNRGTFEPANPDIRLSRATPAGQPTTPADVATRAEALMQAEPAARPTLTERARKAVEASNEMARDPEKREDALGTVVHRLQDRFIDLKWLQGKIKAQGGTVNAINDAYRGEELYHGRAAAAQAEFLDDELRPMLEQMQRAGIGLEQFEKYLHARHAPEANREMAKRNLSAPELEAKKAELAQLVKSLEVALQKAKAEGTYIKGVEEALSEAKIRRDEWRGAQAWDGTEEDRLALSGMSDAEAAAVLEAVPKEKRAAYESLAAQADKMNNRTRAMLVEYGLISKADAAGWASLYKSYVPLHRDEAHPGSRVRRGQGFSVKGKESQRRTGSTADVTNILAHMASQRETTITRGEKNAVAKKLWLLAAQNPIKGFWSLEVPKASHVDPATGLVVRGVDKGYMQRDNVLVVKIAGKEHAVVFDERNERAMRMAGELKNLDAPTLEGVTRVAAKVTGWLAAVNTQYNPVFGVINFMRDTQAAALQLSTTALKGRERDVVAGAIQALRAIWRAERGKNATDPAQKSLMGLWREMQHAGGMTGYRDAFPTIEDRVKALDKMLAEGDRGKSSKAMHAAIDVLSDYNQAMEGALRLSAYRVGIASGMTQSEAASIAKNLTVNFNRKGTLGRSAAPWFAFFNAAVQGSARMIETLRGPNGKRIVLGGVLLGFAVNLVSMALMGGGDDDDEQSPWQKIPDFVKERALILGAGEHYIAIPMPLGYNIFTNAGRIMAEHVKGEGKPGEGMGGAVVDALRLALTSFNPFGGSDLVDAVTPTPADPVVALLRNKDWTGKQIAIENMSGTDPTPGHARAKDGATPWSKALSSGINLATGGTEYQPGALSPTPDQIDYLVGQLTGGVGREIGKLATTVASPFNAEELPANKVPLLSRLYGNTKSPQAGSELFYENVKKANQWENEIVGRSKAGEKLDDIPVWAYELASDGNGAEKRVRALRQRKRFLIRRDEEGDKAQVKEIEVEMGRAMDEFNRRVNEGRRTAVQ